MKKPVHILFSFLVLFAAGSSAAQDIANAKYPADPDTQTHAGVPKGALLNFEFRNSKIYPGTRRMYSVYIPAAYDPGKPACLYVCMDGILFNATTVFDNLIAKGEMPVTIGVFISAGAIIKNDTEVVRFNRSNEFDNTNGRFARFLLEELLPEIERKKTTDGKAINISHKPADRCIAGASSGAICAFTAAWERPDAFSRVYSSIGTFVGMRGGNEYPTLIRKTEPKPIRIFLQDGSKDAWNPLFGSWYASNLNMEAALSFAGYEVNHAWGEGGHDGIQATAIFPDVMRWLWKGWPEPVKAGPSANNLLTTLLVDKEPWVYVGALPELKGKLDSRLDTAAGRLLPARHLSADGAIITDKGDIYAIRQGIKRTDAGKLWLFRPDGSKLIVDSDVNMSSALAISPNKKMLVVGEEHSHWIICYTIADDGTLTDKQKPYWIHNAEDVDDPGMKSMIFDKQGNLFVATAMGVQICDPNGRVRGILTLPGGAIDQVWFGGDGLDTLFVICGSRVYKRKVSTAGAPSWMHPFSPPSVGAG